jgi:hypothetical protein
MNQQTCKVCGRPDKFDFHVPDDIWNEVVPAEFRRKVVCLACFDDFARQRDVEYASHLHTLYFAGGRASFQFEVVSAATIADNPPMLASTGTRCTARQKSAC